MTEDLQRDIWQPFVRAYAAKDIDAFAALHTPDLLRVEAASDWAGGLEEYLDRVRPFFADLAAKLVDLRIGFRFTEHVMSGAIASERGVYQIVMGEQTFYGRFHTFARLVDGRWRVAVDYDTNQGVGEDDYYGAG